MYYLIKEEVMEALKTITRISFLMLISGLATGVFAQEYDDMYFNSNDRKKVKRVEDDKSEDKAEATYESYTNNTYSEKYSAHEVNPEYIARYQSGNSQNSYTSGSSVSDYTTDGNANYREPSASNISYSYYPDEYTVEETPEGTTIINNYYRSDPRFNNNNWNNPSWAFNTWYDPFWGWNSGMSISFGWGNGYWCNPWYGGYNPYWGWNSWAFSGGFGYGPNSWYGGGFYGRN